MRSSVPALHALHVALDALPPPHSRQGPALGNWRWTVRQRLAAVRTILVSETDRYSASWLQGPEGDVFRQRGALLERVHSFDALVLQSPEPDVVRRDLMRLLIDVDNHVFRVGELVAAGASRTAAAEPAEATVPPAAAPTLD
ncbi:hypothetical protein [Nocardioides alkalitolerans]|uniref:hypothetical protein n=1 Tax=Nocardioides alkalitolerans TaxID=281714 RepID=UPI000426A31F|nr:hypothetical protein [Nocardioides alkalitolerans]